MTLKVLILEDNVNDAELMERALRNAGLDFSAMRVDSQHAFETALSDYRPELVLSDFSLPSYNGRAAVEYVQKNFPDVPVIMVTGALGEEAAVDLLKAGARDYVLKDRISRLPFAIAQVLKDVENARARSESEKMLRLSEARFRNTLEYAQGGIGIAWVDGRFIEVNQSICKLLGYTREELLQLGLIEVTHPDDREKTLDHIRRLLHGEIGSYQMEELCMRKGGLPVWVQVMVSLLRDESGEPLNLICQMEDITERKRSQEAIRQMAYYDALTGLPNRRLLLDRLNQALAQAQRHQRSLAVMFLDLDRFKDINDTLGHDIGDELLKVVAERLELCVRGGDTVSRLGGDEFVIVLSEITQLQDVAQVAEKMLALLATPVTIREHSLRITTSIGIAIYQVGSQDDAERLIKKADMAMYRAKESGRNRLDFYG